MNRLVVVSYDMMSDSTYFEEFWVDDKFLHYER
jgi:hypothetical protein